MSQVAPAVSPPIEPAAPVEAPVEDKAREAGRGGLAVAGAKVFFLLVGLVQQTLLPRALGIEGYGAFSRVLALVNVVNNVVIASGIQGASRVVAEAPAAQNSAVAARVARFHAMMAVPLALGFMLLAPWIAVRMGAPHIVGSLRVVSGVVLAYALYAPLIGILNGRRRFATQATLDVTYGVFRTVGMLVGGWLLAKQGLGPLGASAGFALAAWAIVPLAAGAAGVLLTKMGLQPAASAINADPASDGATSRANNRASNRDYLRFLAPLALGQLFLNLLMQVDITLLGKFATDSALAAGAVGAAATGAADRSVAIYRACQLFSFLPYQILFSITFILFPMLAKAHGEGDHAAVAEYVKTGLRLACLIVGAMVSVTFGLAPQLLHFAFRAEIADYGAPALRLLALGQGAFALFGVLTTILSSLHRERWTLVLNAAATGLVVVLAYLLVPSALPGAPAAERAALATSFAMAMATGVGAVAVFLTARALVGWLTVVRVGAAFAAAAGLGTYAPTLGKLMTPVLAMGVVAIYLGVLAATGELGARDVALVRRVLKR